MGLSLKAQVASLPPQGTRAGQCQTPSIYLAAKLSETYLSWGEGHHSWAVGMEGRREREREIRNKDAVSKHQEIQSTFTPEVGTNK